MSMDVKILVPSMGESIVEATVVHWIKNVGDPVSIGEPLVELETNKANLEIGAEHNGTLTHIEKQEGQDVRVGETLGTISVKAGETARPAPELPIPEEGQNANLPSTPDIPLAARTFTKENITPVAMNIAREHDLDPSLIPGSGARGKVLKDDVEKFLAETTKKPSEISPIPRASQDIREEHIRLSRRRRTIAYKLVETQKTAAMLTTFNDVDMSAVMKIRLARKQLFKEKYGVGLGIVSFFVKAAILGLKDFPQLNAEILGDEMIIKHYYDIGIAIGDEEGLVVPILRDADRMTFVEIEKAIQGFVQKTKDHKLSLEDITGGTFTITNGGVFGSLLSTPILNGPEVGILGLHRIEDRAVVVNGEIIIRPMMYLALSYDHRIVDGREAVLFLGRIKEAIQDPEVLLLGV